MTDTAQTTVQQPTKPVTSPAQPSVPTAVIDDDQIVAKPLIDPDFTNFKPKNPNLIFRFGNRVAQGGGRYDQLVAMGFVPATYADVDETTRKIPDHMKRDSKIIYGDLILMKMSRVDYIGALKNNERNALARLGKGDQLAQGKKQMKDALNEVSGSSTDKAKVKLFRPEI